MRVGEWGTINLHLIVLLNYPIPSFMKLEIGEIGNEYLKKVERVWKINWIKKVGSNFSSNVLSLAALDGWGGEVESEKEVQEKKNSDERM